MARRICWVPIVIDEPIELAAYAHDSHEIDLHVLAVLPNDFIGGLGSRLGSLCRLPDAKKQPDSRRVSRGAFSQQRFRELGIVIRGRLQDAYRGRETSIEVYEVVSDPGLGHYREQVELGSRATGRLETGLEFPEADRSAIGGNYLKCIVDYEPGPR